MTPAIPRAGRIHDYNAPPPEDLRKELAKQGTTTGTIHQNLGTVDYWYNSSKSGEQQLEAYTCKVQGTVKGDEISFDAQ
ncbi:hypothetical protein DSL72_002693 [Monilinia vaccinii-corymbosi]|uniref:Uncharacterized protein n=1 Tax=Monilinia vaccinii-corymbosi TaxID=61207 RepID=A0A8A3PDC9_9HELO|nr:hypothetical protein DSL72_002693 [Monilinia vaccinii-corymbosi]